AARGAFRALARAAGLPGHPRAARGFRPACPRPGRSPSLHDLCAFRRFFDRAVAGARVRRPRPWSWSSPDWRGCARPSHTGLLETVRYDVSPREPSHAVLSEQSAWALRAGDRSAEQIRRPGVRGISLARFAIFVTVAGWIAFTITTLGHAFFGGRLSVR